MVSKQRHAVLLQIRALRDIFKRLSLKDLSALQDHEGGAGTGKKNNYTRVSLRLCTSTHSHIFCIEKAREERDEKETSKEGEGRWKDRG